MKVTTLGIDLAKSIFRAARRRRTRRRSAAQAAYRQQLCRFWRSFHHVWWEWRLVPERILGA
jgi:hypothetical protein